MAKINLNGTTVGDKTTGKTSAKKAGEGIANIISILQGSMDPTVAKNINIIKNIASLF